MKTFKDNLEEFMWNNHWLVCDCDLIGKGCHMDSLKKPLQKLLAEATKAERERCMNIVLQFQGEVEGLVDDDEMKYGAIPTCIELRKRLK